MQGLNSNNISIEGKKRNHLYSTKSHFYCNLKMFDIHKFPLFFNCVASVVHVLKVNEILAVPHLEIIKKIILV